VARARGDLARAASLARASVARAAGHSPADPYNIAMGLARLAAVALASGQPARAARRLGTCAALLPPAVPPALQPEDRPVVEGAVAAARAALSGAAFEGAWAAGAALTLEQAVAEALGEEDAIPAPPAAPAPRDPAGLTRREEEVLRLLARGATDAAIAAELSISRKTVGVHVANILGKTNCANRTAAAAFAVRHGLA
jgi:DNA-binding CsgD family transcriptional regulator